MNKTVLIKRQRYTAQKVLMGLLLLALMLLLTRIGARHYFKEEAPKIGTFPVMLGRVFALWTIALLLLQPILAVRARFLDKIFGLDALLRFHRFSGIACLTLAFFHPLLMYVSGLKQPGPLSLSQWPEAIGGICIAALWLNVISSVWRKFVALSYEQWLSLHKILAPVTVLALTHMFVIESAMRKGWLLGFWVVLLLLWAGIMAATKFMVPARLAAGEAFVVSAVSQAAEKIWQITMKPENDNEKFSFLPGQFAFVSFENPDIPQEQHPFTIASAPSDSSSLQFLIKASGDYTDKLDVVKVGNKARVSGPFGVFSPFRHEITSLIMIAGGIGITPMLSTLRQLNQQKSDLPVKLIWTIRTSAEAPCLAEFAGLRQTLPCFEFNMILTRESPVSKEGSNRLNQHTLSRLLPEFKPGSMVMLCGPSVMMSDVKIALQDLGYPRAAILSEEFTL